MEESITIGINNGYSMDDQSMIYAIEDEKGGVNILKNDIIQPLLILLEEYRKEGNTLKPRRLANYRINICIIELISTDEERELFKQLTNR